MNKVKIELTYLEAFQFRRFLKRKNKITWLGFGCWKVEGESLRLFTSYWEARKFRELYLR